MMIRTFIIGVVLYGSLVVSTSGQDLAEVGKGNAVSLSGGLNLNQILYLHQGQKSSRDPYSYYASGNLSLSIYGWAVPFSFSVSNRNRTFTQPFNQYSIHPTYKDLTTHIGYTSVSYSPYSVNGHIFLGGAVDYAPEGNWRVSALYGRFLKAVQPDSTNADVIAAFRRMGYGLKTSFNKQGNLLEMTIFHAADDEGSVQIVPGDSSSIKPQENLVLSIAAGKTIFQNFLVRADLATSAISSDTRSPETGRQHLTATLPFLYTSRVSSSYYNARKLSLNYQHELLTLGIAWENIDPQYRTFGAYYFNNDLENITINAATAILEKKMNIAVSAGRQHDNLNNQKLTTLSRTVISLNVNFNPTDKFSLATSYSNFQSYANIRSQFQQINQLTPYENMDTLSFTQISQNANVVASFVFGKNDSRKQNLSINASLQTASDDQVGTAQANASTQFYNLNTSYSISVPQRKMVASLSFNATTNSGGSISSRTLGPVASLSKVFFQNKVRAIFSTAYNETFGNGGKTNSLLNARANTTLSIRKKHKLAISFVAVRRQRMVTEGGVDNTFDFTGTIGYNYSFGFK